MSLSASQKSADYPLDPEIVFVVSGHTEKVGDLRIVVINVGYEHVSSRVRLEWLGMGQEQAALIKESVWIDEIGKGMLSVGMPIWSSETARFGFTATHTELMDKYQFTPIPLDSRQYELRKISTQ